MCKTCIEMDSLSLHMHKVSDSYYKIYVFYYLLSKNDLTVQYAFHIIGRTACQPIITSVLSVTICPILCQEQDCNTPCHNIFIMIHSLVYRLDYHEATVSIIISYHKEIILLALLSAHVSFTKKYEFLYPISFPFLMSSFSTIYNSCNVLYCLRLLNRH